MSGRKLMIAEDCEPAAQLLANSLAEDFAPTQRAGTLAARELWHADPDLFDLVIGGLDLPEGTGDDRRHWPDARTPRRVPLIAIAGGLPDVRRSRTNFTILSKPFCMEDSIQAINEAHFSGIFPRFEIAVNNNMGCLPYENHSSNIKMSGFCKTVNFRVPG